METFLISLITSSVVAAIVTAVTNLSIERMKQKTEFMAEQVVRELLESPQYKKRSFAVIQRRFGEAFPDNELRKILVRAGAVRYERKHTDQDEGQEFWGLLSRNRDQL
ncbi:hypothetical protein [Nitrospira sp. Nam74]